MFLKRAQELVFGLADKASPEGLASNLSVTEHFAKVVRRGDECVEDLATLAISGPTNTLATILKRGMEKMIKSIGFVRFGGFFSLPIITFPQIIYQ